jgi:hypothetical protein
VQGGDCDKSVVDGHLSMCVVSSRDLECMWLSFSYKKKKSCLECWKLGGGMLSIG